MIRLSRLLAATLLSTVVAGVAMAQTPALAPRLGLWEMTSTVNMGGAMPGVDLSKMPPEQRARMEAAMKNMMADRTETNKSCLTAENLKDPNFMMGNQNGMKCTQTINTNTRTVLDANVVCTGDRTMNGQTHIELPTPTTMKGTVKMQSGGTGAGAAQAMQVNMTMSGKWLAADCGDVK